MSAREEKFTKYMNDNGSLQRLLEILQELVDIEPLPEDPLMYILHAIGCPLIPEAQMKVLEHKVSCAQDELRYLRRVLVDLGGEDYLYDSDTDENDYIGIIGGAPFHSPDSTIYEESSSSGSQYLVEASIAVKEEPQSDLEDEKACGNPIHGKVEQF